VKKIILFLFKLSIHHQIRIIMNLHWRLE